MSSATMLPEARRLGAQKQPEPPKVQRWALRASSPEAPPQVSLPEPGLPPAPRHAGLLAAPQLPSSA